MKKVFGITPLVALVVLVGVFALYYSPLAQAHNTQTIHVVEHAITDTEVPAKKQRCLQC